MGQTKFSRAKVPKHVRVLHSMMDTDAWRAASGNSIKVLLALVRRDNGMRNGEISFSCREAAIETGLSIRTSHKCLQELQELGFIRCTQKGAFNRKVLHASLWRYTWQAWPEGKMGPTREYETWRPDGKSRWQVSSSPVAVSSNKVETHPLLVADIATEQSGKSLVSANPNSAAIATHTIHQAEPSASPETEQRKQASHPDRAILAPLRAALLDHLKVSEPGEQSRLADRLNIPGGTLSKFINGRNLPAQYRIALASALEWSEAA
jgi:hypothetical protein